MSKSTGWPLLCQEPWLDLLLFVQISCLTFFPSMKESLKYSSVDWLHLAFKKKKRKKTTVFTLVSISPQNSHKACEPPTGGSSPRLLISHDVHGR